MANRKSPPIGTGLAGRAKKAITGRGEQLAKQECKAMGGKWVNGECQMNAAKGAKYE